MEIIPENRQLNAGNLEEASDILSAYEAHSIRWVNWPTRFPGKPRTEFRMAHNGAEELFIRFTVEEPSTMALVKEDNGKVCTDSCVEFFLSLDDTGYYNFEFTCIGKTLLGFRKERPNAIHATPEIIQSVKRFPSLGTVPFEEKRLDAPWDLTIAIPISALFKHQLKEWKGVRARMNLYKCGDNLSTPHYLSWAPIDTEKPDFHVPRCFKEVIFV